MTAAREYGTPRCPHGFFRRAVACVTCDGGIHEPDVKPDYVAPVVAVGSTIGGAVMLSAYRRYAMMCLCACGSQFVRSRSTLRKALSSGDPVMCAVCKRKEGGA